MWAYPIPFFSFCVDVSFAFFLVISLSLVFFFFLYVSFPVTNLFCMCCECVCGSYFSFPCLFSFRCYNQLVCSVCASRGFVGTCQAESKGLAS